MIKSVYARLVLKAVVLSVALTLPLWAKSFTVQLTIRGLYLGILAMSFILLAGYGDMTSLAQMSFAAMAGYVIGIGFMRFAIPHGQLAVLAVIGSILLSALFGLVAIRAQKTYFLIMTLALSLLFHGVGMQWATVTGGSDGITGIPRPVLFGFSLIQPGPLYYLTFVSTAICYFGLRHIVRSRFGLVLQGIRDNPRRMSALGFNIQRHRYCAIIISGAVAGIAGILTVYFTGVILPDRAGLGQTILVVLASLVGGVYTLKGGILGGLVVAYLISIAGQLTSRYWVVLGALFIMVVVFMPNGLLGGDIPVKRWLAEQWRRHVSVRLGSTRPKG
jgi:branched-chain amino acid transport system permease protein